jgi:hypothetical protein
MFEGAVLGIIAAKTSQMQKLVSTATAMAASTDSESKNVWGGQ